MKTTPQLRAAMRNTVAAYPGTLDEVGALLDDFEHLAASATRLADAVEAEGYHDGTSLASAVADVGLALESATEFVAAPKPHHPMQPIVLDCDGVARFRGNRIVRFLLDYGGIDLNQIARADFTRADRQQFAQLIGYSVSGYGDLSYADSAVVNCADGIATRLGGTKT
jgi:hypothetical protein